MSYILDALKKSEKERRRGSIPDPLTVQESVQYEPKKRTLWPYLIIVALLVNAAVFALWFDLRSKKPDSITKSISERPESNGGEKPALALTARGEDGQLMKSDPLEPVVAHNRDKIGQNRPEQTGGAAQKGAQDRQEILMEGSKSYVVRGALSKEVVAANAQTGRKSDNIVLPAPNRIYNLGELPLTIRQDIPEVLISVSLYSDDPVSRMVRVNGQVMKEGQYLKEGLKLEQIIPSGVIFSYQNYRFLIGPK